MDTLPRTLKLKNNKGKIIGSIEDPVLIYLYLYNVKMISTLISVYNLVIFHGLNFNNTTDLSILKGYLLSKPNVQRHGDYLKLLGGDTHHSVSQLPKISPSQKLEILKSYRAINALVHTGISDLNFSKEIKVKPPRIKAPVTLASLLDKLASDPKAYIPAYHEDYVYSDANWSSRDAHL